MEILKEKVVGGQGYALMVSKTGKYSIHISYANKAQYRQFQNFGTDKDTAEKYFEVVGTPEATKMIYGEIQYDNQD